MITDYSEFGITEMSLGTSPPNKAALLKEYPIEHSIAWTIAFLSKVKIPVKNIRPKSALKGAHNLKWDMMTQMQQWNYIKYVYVPGITQTAGFTRYTGYPELHSSGNVHCHIVIYSVNPQWDCLQFRRLCSQHTLCVKVHVGKNEHRLNFIHTVKESGKDGKSWLDYITKSHT